jgi:thiol-disulfide isomerase/thioredoxin
MKTFIMICSIMACTLIKAQTVQNFQLKNLENQTRSFVDLKGEKLTLIDFWASWCKPCLKAIPELNKIYAEYKSKGVEIIGINCDGPRSVAKVAPLSQSLQIKYPVLLDINSEVMNNLGLQAFPTLLLVNSEGSIVWTHEGYVTGDAEIIISEIEKNLENK